MEAEKGKNVEITRAWAERRVRGRRWRDPLPTDPFGSSSYSPRPHQLERCNRKRIMYTSIVSIASLLSSISEILTGRNRTVTSYKWSSFLGRSFGILPRCLRDFYRILVVVINDPHRILGEDFWRIFGGFCGDFWGIFAGYLWDFCANFVGYLWDICGIFAGFLQDLWNICRIFVGFSWQFPSTTAAKDHTGKSLQFGLLGAAGSLRRASSESMAVYGGGNDPSVPSWSHPACYRTYSDGISATTTTKQQQSATWFNDLPSIIHPINSSRWFSQWWKTWIDLNCFIFLSNGS